MRAWRGWLYGSVVAVLVTVLGGSLVGDVEAQPARAGSALFSNGLVVDGADLLIPDQRSDAARALHASPQAVVARWASENAYRALGATAADRLAAHSFPSLIDVPDGGPPRLSMGQKLNGFASRYAARIDGGSPTTRALVVSNAPMAMLGEHGSFSAVSLALRASGGGFRPANPLVEVWLPRRLSEGAQLPVAGLTVTPLNGRGRPASGSAGVSNGTSVFAANTLPSTDTVLKPSTYGFALDTVLRSGGSPQRLSFRVGLPAGARLVPIHDAHGALRVVREGQTVALMPAPSAKDAAGTPVPVSVSVHGDVVELTVSHRAGDYLYPIAVDPEFNSLTSSTKLEPTIWAFTTSGKFVPFFTPGYAEMLIDSSGSFANGEWGAFNYQTKGNSKIYEISTTTTFEPTEGNGTEYWLTKGEDYLQLANSGGVETYSTIAHEYVHLTEYPRKSALCASVCSPEGGATGNAASIVERATLGGSGLLQLRVQAAAVSIGQPKEVHSTVRYNTTSPEIEYSSGGKMVKTPNVLYGSSGWIGPNSGALEFISEDTGLGVSGTSVSVKEGSAWAERVKHNYLTEGGCADVQCAASQKEAVTYSMLKGFSPINGNTTIRVAAHDPMANTWSSEHAEGETAINVDSKAPHGAVLHGLASEYGEGYEIDESVDKIKVEVSDGEGSTPSSGMKSIALEVDGREIATKSATCVPGPCTGSSEFNLNGGELGAGRHTLTIVGTDNVGNVASFPFTLHVYHAAAAPVGPGSVNVESGNFQLQATDVEMSGGMGALTVSRTYQSRYASAGTGGPLGSQWRIALGSEAGLEVGPDGSVSLLGLDGGSFFPKSGSGFSAPLGDSNLTLEAVEQGGKITSYLLKDKSDATTTKFTLPTGSKLWLPTVSEGAVATSTTTDEYTTAEPERGRLIVEPILEVAPHQSATCTFLKLEKGCRALEFNYATKTTATGESESQWGDYKGNLTRVYFTAWDPVKKEMTTKTVAQYSYDAKGRLRAEWNPQISPALKTIYGYDAEGHVTALTPPGQESWAFVYGSISGDATPGRLMRVARAPASASLWSGSAPTNSALPTVTPEPPALGATATASAGTWSGSPIAYRYQWQRCNSAGGACVAIAGAMNETYKPTMADAGYDLRVEVQAINGGGSTAAYSVAAKVVAAPLSYQSKFGSWGTGNGQLKWAQGVTVDGSGNVWVADTFNNRIEEFSSSGTFIRTFGTLGTGNGQLKEPFGIGFNSEGNLWVVDAGNNRVEKFSPSGEYLGQFGTGGSGAGQFAWPNGISITPEGNIWIADTNNNRIQEFSSTGAYIRSVTGGTGHELSVPKDVASDAYGDVWVTDSGHSRVEEFESKGGFLLAFGSEGSGHGQFKESRGIAVDSSGEVWVTDRYSGRVQGFNSSGEFLTQYGGLTEFNEPEGIAVTKSGTVYVADTVNSAVQILQAGAVTPLSSSSSFAAYGTGAESTSWQQDIALDASGNVWVADALNNCVWEFSSSGAYLKKIGSVGTGNGQLKGPSGVAITAEGNIWVVDSGNSRIEEFSPSGGYIRQFGTEGSSSGQFYLPHGITIEPGTGNIAIADAGNNRIQLFNASGGFIREIQGAPYALSGPEDVAADSEGNLWVADTNNNRVMEFTESGVYMRRFGSYGGGRGQLNGANGLTIDSAGNVWVTDSSNDRIEAFTSKGEFLAEYGGWPQFYDDIAMAISSNGTYYVLNSGYGRVETFTLPATSTEAPGAPRTEGAAFNTIEYNVPVSGSGAPYSMTSSQLARWEQTDRPTKATAILPPDSPQGWPAASYTRAVVYYMDPLARTTNVARPGGGISTTEYNEVNETTRELTAANRAAALEAGSKSKEVSKLRDTQNTYSEETGQLLETLGPQHTVKIAKGNEKVPTGSEALVRDHVKYYYDEGAPINSEVYSLATKVTNGAETAAREELDVRTTTTSYSGQSNLGWQLREPTSRTVDPSGLKLTTTTVYDETTGRPIEVRGAASPGANDPHDTVSIYYTAEANSSYPTCGGHVEWAGLPCETLPGKQPESGLPALPVRTTSYNIWNQPETVTEAFGTTTRTTKTTFDSAGRAVTTEVSATTGASVPAVTDHYDEKTGALVKESEVVEGSEKAVTSQFNTLGEVETYTDADGGKTTYKYDVDSRTTEMASYTGTGEERGKQTYSYDATTGLMTKLVDSATGTFTAGYEIEGKMTSETYPNKMTATMTYNQVGEETGIEYAKTAFCASSCPERWSSDVVVPSVHGEALSESGTLGEEPKISYDAAGRLTEVQEIPTGQGCTTRIYAYDEESNRTSLTTRAPGSEGKCATEGGATESHSYDAGNRLMDSGVVYESLGNITKLPAADSGGAAVTSSYYADSQLYSQEQSGKTMTYYMDPDGRTRETRSPGVSVIHYAGPGEAVAWTLEPEAKWTRNIPGIDGSMVGTQTSAGVVTLLVHDLHGNVIGTAALEEKQSKLLSTYKSTEFGVPVNGTAPKYSWLGALGVSSESATGLMVQDGLAYIPQTGKPLQSQGMPVPSPDNAATAYVMTLASWVAQNTEALAKQLTEAEEAERKATDSFETASWGEWGSGKEEDWSHGNGSVATASSVSSCEASWSIVSEEESVYLRGFFKCEHHVANVKIQLCLFWQAEGEITGHQCTSEKGAQFDDIKEHESAVYGGCNKNELYTGFMWIHEWADPEHKAEGTWFTDRPVGSSEHPWIECEGEVTEGAAPDIAEQLAQLFF